MKTRYSPRVDALLDRLGTDLTERDFAELALACADQAGVLVREQDKIAALLGIEQVTELTTEQVAALLAECEPGPRATVIGDACRVVRDGGILPAGHHRAAMELLIGVWRQRHSRYVFGGVR